MSAPIIRSSRSSFDAVIGSGSSIIIDPNVSVTRNASDHPLDGAHVFILSGYNAGQDVLSVDPALVPTGLTATWDSPAGVLRILMDSNMPSGSFGAPVWQTILRGVKFSSTNIAAGSKEINFVLGEHLALTVGGRARYYEFVENTNITWTNARTAAKAKTFFGLQGYLANITTSEENEFIKSRIRSANNQIPRGWLGGTDSGVEGEWEWVDGPEAGTFWSGGFGGGVQPGYFSSWSAVAMDPHHGSANIHTEDYVLYREDGLWGDLRDDGQSTINGFVVEYGGYDNDPSLTISASVVAQLQTSSQVASGNAQEIDALLARITALESAGVAGPQGAQGVAGVPGASGQTGAMGQTGATGAQGPQGVAGVAGADGADGSDGSNGAAGPRGAMGPMGTQGVQGDPGIAGSDGATGAQGAQGERGAQGVAGAAGVAGSDGATGATGASGADGAQGVAGVAGDPGAQGVAGVAGPSGAAGMDGMQGPTGQTGPIGPAGADGDDFNGDARLTCVEEKMTQLVAQMNAAKLLSGNGTNFNVSCD